MFIIAVRSVILPSLLAELQGEQFCDLAVLLISLSMCIVLPLSGYLSDIYGRKNYFLSDADYFPPAVFSAPLHQILLSFLHLTHRTEILLLAEHRIYELLTLGNFFDE
ncbi:MAG TPA: hypothetical protein IAA51_05510 [Candidatus Cottocaccamicrobium excrementipullorum]|nr:hypothetical protein [Candidatus Cottocaccamicrobium excrementipullorum]